jgi:hypothetical protein
MPKWASCLVAAERFRSLHVCDGAHVPVGVDIAGRVDLSAMLAWVVGPSPEPPQDMETITPCTCWSDSESIWVDRTGVVSRPGLTRIVPTLTQASVRGHEDPVERVGDPHDLAPRFPPADLHGGDPRALPFDIACQACVVRARRAISHDH